MPVMGLPATIDNDIGCSNYTIGFDSACNTAIECIDKLRDTMQSHERCSVVEVMGRHAGFLALYVGLAVGATSVLIPEREVDFDRDVVQRIQNARLAGATHFMIVVAEGAGSAIDYGRKIKESLGMDPRVTVLGHIQRGGETCINDRLLGSLFGVEAVNLIAKGESGKFLVFSENKLKVLNIKDSIGSINRSLILSAMLSDMRKIQAWLEELLESPDLAITEAAVGAGVTTLLFFGCFKKIGAIKEAEIETTEEIEVDTVHGYENEYMLEFLPKGKDAPKAPETEEERERRQSALEAMLRG